MMNWKKKTKKGQTAQRTYETCKSRGKANFLTATSLIQSVHRYFLLKASIFFSPTQRWWLYCMLYVDQGPYTMLTELGCFFLCSQPHCGSRTVLATQQKYFTTSKCPTLQKTKQNILTDDGKLIGSIYNIENQHIFIYLFCSWTA